MRSFVVTELVCVLLLALSTVNGKKNKGPSEKKLTKLHTKIDLDGDGHITVSEFTQYKHKMDVVETRADIQSHVDDADKNEDGRLSLKEYIAQILNGATDDEMEQAETKKFHTADKDKDGYLKGDELVAAYNPHADDLQLTSMVEEILKRYDFNQDGKVDQTEFFNQGAPPVLTKEQEELKEEFRLPNEEKKEFDRLDMNMDGTLDLEEMKHWEKDHHSTVETMEDMVKAVDEDGDGKLAVHEFATSKKKLNHKVTSDEYLIQHGFAWSHLKSWAKHEEF